jgi:hypothetical protein
MREADGTRSPGRKKLMRLSKYIVSVRPHRSSSEIDRCLLESRQLPVSRPDLFTRQSIAPRAIEVFIKVLAITTQRKLSRQSFEEVKQMAMAIQSLKRFMDARDIAASPLFSLRTMRIHFGSNAEDRQRCPEGLIDKQQGAITWLKNYVTDLSSILHVTVPLIHSVRRSPRSH